MLRKFIDKFGFYDFIIIIFVLSLAGRFDSFCDDPGMGWHLAAGEWILQHGSLPQADPFLAAARPWILEQWLSEVILAAIYRVNGWPFAYAVLLAVFFCSYFILLGKYCKSLVSDVLVAVLVCMMAACMGKMHFLMRPVMFSYPCFIVVSSEIYLLLRAIKNGDENAFKICKRRSIVTVPLAMLLWANLHPSFILGVATCFWMLVSLCLDKVLINHAIKIPFKFLTILCLVTLGVTLINPYGADLYSVALNISNSSYVKELFSEWHPIKLRGEAAGDFLRTYLILFLIGLFVSRGKGLKWGFFELCFLLGLLYQTLTSVRMTPYFAIAVTIPLAEVLNAMIRSFEDNKYLTMVASAWDKIVKREAKTGQGILVSLLLVILWCSYALVNNSVLLYHGTLGPSRDEYPYEAMDLIKERETQDKVVTVVNDMDWGGFITWYGEGRIKGVIDDRSALLGVDFMKRYLKLFASDDVEELMKENQSNYLLVRAGHPALKKIKGQHPEAFIYEDKKSVLIWLQEAGS